MFKKLRNRLILINLSITTFIILAVFSAIYIIATRSASERPAFPDISTSQTLDSADIPDNFQQIVNFSIREEKKAAANNLLITLVAAGIAIEISVALVSYFLAEEAIKPVKDAYESQKVFIANASHEIKTPLAAISANLEAADLSSNKWIKNVELETEKLAALNSELLALARTDLVSSASAELTNPKSDVEKTVQSFAPRLARKTYEYEINFPAKLKLNTADFIQILSILLDNATKYSKNLVRVKINGRELAVENDGKKISTKELPYIFDRFYQADKSAEGVGLGLSIAKSLAERNGWSLQAESNKTTIMKLNF